VSEPSHTEADHIACPEFRGNLSLDRRGFVKAGGLGLWGLSLATIYRHLGLDIKANYTDFTGRLTPVLPYGDPIEELF